MTAYFSYFKNKILQKVFNDEPNQIVVATFKFVDGKKAEFEELLKGPQGLKVTREFEGCISIKSYDDQDDPNNLILVQEWKSRSNHEAYLNMRKDTGLLETLQEMLSEPLKPVYLTETSI